MSHTCRFVLLRHSPLLLTCGGMYLKTIGQPASYVSISMPRRGDSDLAGDGSLVMEKSLIHWCPAREVVVFSAVAHPTLCWQRFSEQE